MALPQLQEQRLRQRKAQLLPWIADPLTHVLHNEHEEHQQSGAEHHESQKKPASSNTSVEATVEEEIEAEEAAPIELFYDLFFVANLTTITSVHYMTDTESVISYILFFIILWFTWLQTSLYDIRFSVDSFYERGIKAIHFFVMIGLASVSTSWNPLDLTDENSASSLRSMSLTLMASRFALAIQYAVTVVYARKNKKPIAPFAIHSAVMFLGGCLYLGMYIAFRGDLTKHPKTYIAWYAMIFIEVVAVIASSTIWNVVSFKRTHLVERMGLLSLIILGEGIIVMLKAVNTVEKGTTFGQDWNASLFCVIAAAVLVIYFLYMFYFDYTPNHTHYGTIRQQVWAVLHFPFHLAIVLSVEGLRQLTTWYGFLQAATVVQDAIITVSTDSDPDTMLNNMVTVMYSFINILYDDGSSKTIMKQWDTVNSDYLSLNATKFTDWGQDELGKFSSLDSVLSTGYSEFYGIKVPKKKDGISTKPKLNILDAGYNPFADVQKVYNMVFEYFFISLGVVFVMYGIFGLFVRRRKDVWDYISVAIRFAVGIVFFGIVGVKNNDSAYSSYFLSAWPIPTVCIVLVTALFLDKAIGVIAYRRMKAERV